jgi:hypothetical protein
MMAIATAGQMAGQMMERGPRAAMPAPLRLTRRGRLVVRSGVLVLAMIGVAAAVLLGGGTALGGGQARPLPVTYHQLAPGETLWEVASATAPGEDPRDVVIRIMELNRLPSAHVVAGTRLAIPVRE